jgi:alpha-acetolactate decarboxylase
MSLSCVTSRHPLLNTYKQAEFEFRGVSGTIVGFRTPAYAVNIAGWHLHFLSEDRSQGGHLLDIEGATLNGQVQHLEDFRPFPKARISSSRTWLGTRARLWTRPNELRRVR